MGAELRMQGLGNACRLRLHCDGGGEGVGCAAGARGAGGRAVLVGRAVEPLLVLPAQCRLPGLHDALCPHSHLRAVQVWKLFHCMISDFKAPARTMQETPP